MSFVSNAAGAARIEVSPTQRGRCAIDVTGGGNASAVATVDVTPNPVNVRPERLSFTQTGSDAKQPATVTQDGYAGTFTIKTDCAGIANVAVQINERGTAAFNVVPLARGRCTATFTGGIATSASLAIAVTPPGGVTVSPDSLSFTRGGSSATKSVTVSQKNYAGAYDESDDCGGIASIALASSQRGVATYDITPAANGSCTAEFLGGRNELGRLSISVAIPGNVVVSPSSMTFARIGSTQTARVSQTSYGGSFRESDDCSGKASVAQAGGAATYAVTALAAGSCTATFTGGNDESAALSIAIAPYGGVVVAPSSMSFTAIGSGAAQSASVAQANFAGSYTESDTCAAIAAVAATSNADGRATYRVTPLAAGSCTATFTGGGAASAPLAIDVAPYGGVQVTPPALTFTATGSGAAQRAAVSQSGYAGSFAETDDCSTTASVAVGANGSGKATVTVTPLAAGACSATFAGGNHETAPLAIDVDLPGGVVASPAPLNLVLNGSPQPSVVTVTQSGYSGSFTESDSCSGIATVSQASSDAGIARYDVAPVDGGICSILFTGGNAETFVLHVSVTQTKVVIDRRHAP